MNTDTLETLEKNHFETYFEGGDSCGTAQNLLSFCLKTIPNRTKLYTESNSIVYKLLSRVSLRPEQMAKIVYPFDGNISFSDDFITEARNYVSDLMGVDLSKVQVKKFPKTNVMDVSVMEGCCMVYRVDEHRIFIDPDNISYTTTDLLCHEFGHAGAFTLAKRQNPLTTQYSGHPLIDEAIANYCQLKYLRDHGTRELRALTLCNLLYGYLGLIIYRHCMNNNRLLSQCTIDEIFKLPEVQSIWQSYVEPRHEVENTMRNIQSLLMNRNLIGVVEHRMSMLVSLMMLDNDDLDLHAISHQNDIRNDLSTILQMCHPKYARKINHASQLAEKFIED